MILFAIGILLRLNGIKMKFTQPAKEDDDEEEEDVKQEGADSLDVENKLTLNDKDESAKPRQNMSNVKQHPLTAGLLQQLSDFTPDTFYNVYYTSPSTGEAKKQPLKFSSNRDAVKSFLPIRNAAIQARDDRACGLLCAILIEGCVDDYAGGEVTEEMVANQMKHDFGWTDEQLNELVPPEYVLVQLDVVPDLPEAVQKAEASGEKVIKEKGEGCEKEGCEHEHKH
ncbi:hypothetical protein JCM11491_006795 [Sporobolomyces phaffii]